MLAYVWKDKLKDCLSFEMLPNLPDKMAAIMIIREH